MTEPMEWLKVFGPSGLVAGMLWWHIVRLMNENKCLRDAINEIGKEVVALKSKGK